MEKKLKYKIEKRFGKFLGKPCVLYTIVKKSWFFGMYVKTKKSYFSKATAQKICDRLNKI